MIGLVGFQVDLATLSRHSTCCLAAWLGLLRHEVLDVRAMYASTLHSVFGAASNGRGLTGEGVRGDLDGCSLAARLRTSALIAS